jgi:hypothetical protein
VAGGDPVDEPGGEGGAGQPVPVGAQQARQGGRLGVGDVVVDVGGLDQGGAPGLTAGWTWRMIWCGIARPIDRPWWSTSVLVRSNGVNSTSMMRPTRAGSTWYPVAVQGDRGERGHPCAARTTGTPCAAAPDLLLKPAADLVDGLRTDHDDVEGVQDRHRVLELVVDGVGGRPPPRRPTNYGVRTTATSSLLVLGFASTLSWDAM